MSESVRVLHIDDAAADRELIRDALESGEGGFEVVQAGSREEFEALLADGGYDVILSDFNIFGFDGLDVIDMVNERAPDTPVIIVTGTGSEAVAVESLKRGAADYVIKTLTHIRRLPLAIHAVLDRYRLLAERRMAAEALRDSERRYRLMADNAADNIWLMRISDMRVIYTSPASEAIFGYTPEEMQELELSDYVSAESLETAMALISEALAGGEPAGTGSDVAQVVELEMIRKDGERIWVETNARLLRDDQGRPDRILGTTRNVTVRRKMQDALRDALAEIEQLKARIEAENTYLLEEVRFSPLHADVVANSRSMRAVLAEARLVASTASTVLILGETGTGKEILARAIHRMSTRRDRPFVVVNCAAMPEALVESELFGRERGAYTDASTRQIGRFEVADGSTIFLDEIGELPLGIQSKLLRVLEQGQIERLGSPTPIDVDVRVIAATNRDLEQAVRNGSFRQDLFYRLNVFPLTIPPLRDRVKDIPALTRAFIDEFSARMGTRFEQVSQETIDVLESYSWPGNVRELRNLVERAMIMSTGSDLDRELAEAVKSIACHDAHSDRVAGH